MEPGEDRVVAGRSALLEQVLKQPIAQESQRTGNSLHDFLNATTAAEALGVWFGRVISPAEDDKARMARALNYHVSLIDEQLNRQLNGIIHHPRFQRLEAAWRGLDYLCDSLLREFDPAGPPAKLKVLNVSWKELEADFEEAWDVEQSVIFHKVYEEEFGRAGGEPFGLLLGDYEIKPAGLGNHAHNDLNILSNMAKVAASAFSPFVCNASPELFELGAFRELETTRDYQAVFAGLERLEWKTLTESEDARFIGLAMPRMRIRGPYDHRTPLSLAKLQERKTAKTKRDSEFIFQEQAPAGQSDASLWCGAAFGFASVVMRSFCRSGWLADIRGVRRGYSGGGLLNDLPVSSFSTDQEETIGTPPTDVIITDELEKHLSELGFIPLCSCYDTAHAAFYSARSIQRPQKYEDELATLNSHISAMLHSMLCVSRFAHFLKSIGRDLTGSYAEAGDIEKEMHNWIMDYVTSDNNASLEAKAKFPLHDARVQVLPVSGKSGAYHAVFHLKPHYEIEGMSAGIRLVTELKGPN